MLYTHRFTATKIYKWPRGAKRVKKFRFESGNKVTIWQQFWTDFDDIQNTFRLEKKRRTGQFNCVIRKTLKNSTASRHIIIFSFLNIYIILQNYYFHITSVVK